MFFATFLVTIKKQIYGKIKAFISTDDVLPDRTTLVRPGKNPPGYRNIGR